MTKYRTITFTLLLLFAGVTFGQTTDTISTKLIGKWLLVKHTVSEAGIAVDRLTSDQVYTYDFFKNMTYNAAYKDKGGMALIKGSWKLINAEKEIHFYDNKAVEPNSSIILPDYYDKPIINLSATELVIPEYLYDEEPIGTSYYIKQK
jgi:hypothetical protein